MDTTTRTDLRMRAIVQHRYTAVADLEVGRIERPRPGPGEVLVRVEATAAEPAVWHLATGRPALVRLFGFGLFRPRHRVPGADLAGIVESIGDGVEGFTAGDSVFGTGRGALAEFAVAPATTLAHRPSAVPADMAAASVVAGYTALQAMRTALVRPGERVLVTGAGGGVGTLLVQLALAAGAHVTALCSAGKASTVRALGAHDVLDYATTDAFDGTRSWHVVFDTGGARGVPEMLRATAPTGRLVLIGGEGAGFWRLVDRIMLAGRHSRKGGPTVSSLLAGENGDDIREVAALLESGAMRPVIGATYPLERTGEALRALEQHRFAGRIIVRP